MLDFKYMDTNDSDAQLMILLLDNNTTQLPHMVRYSIDFDEQLKKAYDFGVILKSLRFVLSKLEQINTDDEDEITFLFESKTFEKNYTRLTPFVKAVEKAKLKVISDDASRLSELDAIVDIELVKMFDDKKVTSALELLYAKATDINARLLERQPLGKTHRSEKYYNKLRQLSEHYGQIVIALFNDCGEIRETGFENGQIK